MWLTNEQVHALFKDNPSGCVCTNCMDHYSIKEKNMHGFPNWLGWLVDFWPVTLGVIVVIVGLSLYGLYKVVT